MTSPSFERLSRQCLLATGLLAVGVLLSWTVSTGSVTLPGRVDRPMAPSTAWVLLGLSVTLFGLHTRPDNAWARRSAAVVGGLVLVTGTWVIATVGTDEPWSFPIGVMTPITAVVLMTAATASVLSSLTWTSRVQHQVEATLGMLVAFSGLGVLLGHVMNVPTAIGQPMPAASTGIAFVTLGVGLTAGCAALAWPDLVLLPSLTPEERRKRTRTLALGIGLAVGVCAAVIAMLAWVNAANVHRSARRLVGMAASEHARQIAEWFEGHSADAKSLLSNRLVLDEMRSALGDSPSALLQRDVTNWMDTRMTRGKFISLALVDPAARVRLQVPEDAAQADAAEVAAARVALATGEIQFVDVFEGHTAGSEHLSWVVPLGGTPSVAALIMVANPREQLWPELIRWFDRTSSAEAVLVRRDGDDVMFLNSPRVQPGAPRRVPMAAQPWLPAIRAVNGDSGEVYAPDYRGVPVLAAMRSIEGTPWALVIKMDQREVDAVVWHDTWLIAVAIGASVIVVLLSGVSVWLRREAGVSHHVAELTQRERDSAEQLRLVLESAPDAHILLDAAGTILSWNAQAETTFGWPAADVIGRPVAEVAIPPAERGAHTDGLAGFLATSSGAVVGRRIHVHALHRDGHEFPVELTVIPVRVRGEVMFSEFVRDRTVEVRAEASVRTLTTAVEQTPMSVVITDVTGTISYVNPTFTSVTGYTREEAIGQNPRVLKSGTHDAAFYRQLWETVATSGVWTGEIHNRRKNGELFWESATISQLRNERGALFGYVAIKRDITAEKQSVIELDLVRAQLTQAQKMESVGRLAGGVAHDFNNMLAVILGHAEIALDGLSEDDARREHLIEILQAGHRSADLTRQLLAFARKQTIRPKVVDLNQSVGEMLKMLRRLIGENIEVRWAPGPDLWPVHIDPAQIDQILANLSVNARDAITGGGVVTIATSNVNLTRWDAQAFPRGRAGEFVEISISDTGCGMTPEVLAHLFEPFFTTKEAGKGTGLGTATVYGIVMQNQGFIHVDSTVGVGTSMRVFLPRVARQDVEMPADAHAALPVGTETVLLVEDEPAMLETCRRMLVHLGYTVVPCRSSEEAQTTLATYGGRIHLLLTDVVMPGGSGRELAAAARQRDASVKVLFMSGYTAELLEGTGVGADGSRCLAKPFTTAELAVKVREALS